VRELAPPREPADGRLADAQPGGGLTGVQEWTSNHNNMQIVYILMNVPQRRPKGWLGSNCSSSYISRCGHLRVAVASREFVRFTG